MTTGRKSFTYDVVLGTPEGQREVEYTVFWAPDRVESSEVANSCAAEYRAQGAQVVAISAALRD